MILETLEAEGNLIAMQARAAIVREEVAALAMLEAKDAEKTPEERFEDLIGIIAELADEDGVTDPVRVTHGIPEGLAEVSLRLGYSEHPPDPRSQTICKRIFSVITFTPSKESKLPSTPWRKDVYNYDLNSSTPAYAPLGLAQIEGSLEFYLANRGVVELPLVH